MKKISHRRQGKKLSFGFVVDPLDTFNREAETTLFLMREIFRRGHKIFTFEPHDIFLKQNEPWAFAKEIALSPLPNPLPLRGRGKGEGDFYKILDERPLNLAKLDCLFLRKDPPFDLKYLFHLWLLLPLEERVLMINPPSAILKNNEKLSALNFPFAPKTWVGSNVDALKKWAVGFKNGIVIKPLNSSGGRGVQWIKRGGYQELRTKNQEPIIAQEFLPEVKNGDKRILLWNGKILGAFLRRPTKKGEFRANLHLGGRFEKCGLTSQQKKIAQKTAAWCKREKLLFVGLDMIGPHVTEINVTSPMGIRELNVLYGRRVETKIVDWILKHA